MEAAPSAEVIRATQESLGRFVKRPPLTEKLLSKPPFRFLHDIITSVLRSNGCFDGLFEEAELISENIRDREAKIDFLTKVITVLSLTTGKSLNVKPSKIISGQEPEKTNELLQCLGFALDNNLSTTEAIQKYKLQGNEKTNKKPREQVKVKKESKSSESAALSSKSTEKLSTQKNKRDSSLSKKNNVNKTDKKDAPPSKKDVRVQRESRKEVQNEKTNKSKELDRKEPIKKQDRPAGPAGKSTEKTPKHLAHGNITQDRTKNHDNSDLNKSQDKTELNNISSDQKGLSQADNHSNNNQDHKDIQPMETPIVPVQQHSNQNNSDINKHHEVSKATTVLLDKKEFENAVEDSSNIQTYILSQEKRDHGQTMNENVSTEIDHIKKGIETVDLTQTPELEQKKIESQPNIWRSESPTKLGMRSSAPRAPSARPPSGRPPSARPGAPRPRDKHEDLLMIDEPVPAGKVHVIVENADMDADEDEASLVVVESVTNALTKEDDDNLVMQYSSAEHGHLVQQILDSQKEFSQMQSGKTEIEWEFGAQRIRDASSQDVEQLRFSLQALSRAANPLGKLLDHIQEDVEVMRQELQQWTKTYQDATTELAKQKSGTEQALQPLLARSSQMDTEIAEKRDKINDLKSIIHKNTMRINKLLASGNVQ